MQFCEAVANSNSCACAFSFVCTSLHSPSCRSGTDEQCSEKQTLLEDINTRYEEREDCEVKTAAAKKKDAKDNATALEMRRAALLPLGEKRRQHEADSDEENEGASTPQTKAKQKQVDIRQVLEDRMKLKEQELDMRQQELDLQKQRLAMEQQKADDRE